MRERITALTTASNGALPKKHHDFSTHLSVLGVAVFSQRCGEAGTIHLT
jgi:hypothetical protein